MRKIIITAVILLTLSMLFAESPIVSNVTASQRTDGSKIVDITYDVSDAENDSLLIEVLISNDGGATFTITPNNTNLTGDFGSGIMPGTGKSITWNAGAETTDFDGDNFQLKITADDSPTVFVFVQGGTFQMGDRLDGMSSSLPLHDVTVSSFYMAETEVTQGDYETLMGNNPSNTNYGIGNNRPVNNLSWYNMIKYCNKKSLNESLTPCYSVGGDTNPDNWGSSFTPDVNWNANGYRLPTEAEWEYAARGGIHETDNYRYSGCNNEADLPDYAWYNSNGGSYCKEVGTKLPNQLGLYDMSGNVWEWCWDWYDSYSSSSQDNPHGANSGSSRVIRGGSWYNSAGSLRVANRYYYSPSNSDGYIGFRILRSSN